MAGAAPTQGAQKAVARLLGVSQSSVIHWQRGDVRRRRAPTRARIIAFVQPFPPGVTVPERLRQKRRLLGWGQPELTALRRRRLHDQELGNRGTIMATAHCRLMATFLEVSAVELHAAMRKRWNDSHRKTVPQAFPGQLQRSTGITGAYSGSPVCLPLCCERRRGPPRATNALRCSVRIVQLRRENAGNRTQNDVTPHERQDAVLLVFGIA
jgi:DNA-binding transcriptional regulator YdaS (Cro superfamily)